MADAPPSAARTRRLGFGLVTAGIGAALALGVLELGARGVLAWRAAEPPLAADRLDLLRPNPHGTGSYRLRPNLDLTATVAGRRVRIRTNSHGMPWREVGVERSDARHRVAFVGDSFTFGSWADDYETAFPGVFERNVSRRLWEVMSFGVGGYGLADEELLLREEVLRFGPDYVVIALFNGNDLRDTWLGLDKERLVDGTAELDDAVVRRRVPASQLVEDGTVPRRCPASRPRRLLERSAAFRLAAPLLGWENLCVDFAVNRNFTMYSYWSQHPYPETARAARDLSLEILGRIDALLLERGARLALVTIPTREQVHARRSEGPGWDTALPQDFFRVFARERGIPYLDLLPTLREHWLTTGERLYVPGDTHLDLRGHRLAGERIADWFRCCVKNQPRP